VSDNQTATESLSIADVLAKFGVVEGATKSEPAYVRDVYNALQNGNSSVFVFSDKVDENFLTLMLSATENSDTLVITVDDDAKEIRRRINYRRANQNSAPKVTYGSVNVHPLTTADGLAGVKVNRA
jgi:hypothetical protein